MGKYNPVLKLLCLAVVPQSWTGLYNRRSCCKHLQRHCISTTLPVQAGQITAGLADAGKQESVETGNTVFCNHAAEQIPQLCLHPVKEWSYPYTGLLPYRFDNHFSSIGVIGMNEAGPMRRWLKAGSGIRRDKEVRCSPS